MTKLENYTKNTDWIRQKNSQTHFLIQGVWLMGLLMMGSLVFAQNSRPNIIYILADDLGYGDVSSFNENSKLKTPNIDALAKEGMRFTDAHSNSAVCSPTRYGILTGRYAWRTSLQNGVLWSYDTPLIKKERMTVASLLKGNGYQTACIGKWHLGLDWGKDPAGNVDYKLPVANGPVTIGFDYFYGITASLDIPPYVYIENDRVTAAAIDTIEGTTGKGFWRKGPVGNDFRHEAVLPVLTDKTVTYIREHAKSTAPFFLYYAMPAPHTPILPGKEFSGKSSTNAYGDFVLMVDIVVGKIRKAVQEAGIENNTIIIFTSDNGCSPSADFKELKAFGHLPGYIFRGAKADIYEGGHRVPFVVKWPRKVAAGSICNTTICLTDLMATCASIVKEPLPGNAGEDSYSLLPLLLKNKPEKYLRTSTVHHSIDGNFAIRQDQWKLIFCAGSGGWSYPTKSETVKQHLTSFQLYNLETDIAETNNLIDQYPEITKRLTSQMEKIISEGRSTTGKKQHNDVRVILNK